MKPTITLERDPGSWEVGIFVDGKADEPACIVHFRDDGGIEVDLSSPHHGAMKVEFRGNARIAGDAV